MYKCNCCWGLFEEPKLVRLVCHDFGPPVFRMVERCPRCGKDDFESIEVICGTCIHWDAAAECCDERDELTDEYDTCRLWEIDEE